MLFVVIFFLSRKGAIPTKFLDQTMSEAGLAVYRQNFSVSDPFGSVWSEVS